LVGVIVGVRVGVLVGVIVGVRVGVLVGVIVGVRVGVLVGVIVGVWVTVGVGVLVGVIVGVRVTVGVGVLVGVIVGVRVGVGVRVLVGVIVGVFVGSTTLIAPFMTERPPLPTVSLTPLSELSVASALSSPPVVVMTRLIVLDGQPVRLNTIAPIRSPGAGAAVNGMSPLLSLKV
jgi:hypothetical protein